MEYLLKTYPFCYNKTIEFKLLFLELEKYWKGISK